MMTSYLDLVNEIQALQKQAEKLRQKESHEVLKEIRRLISIYSFSETDLGFRPGASTKSAKRPGKKKMPAVKSKVPARYTDGRGNYWTGRGKQPKWVQSCLSSGRSLESLEIASPAEPSSGA